MGTLALSLSLPQSHADIRGVVRMVVVGIYIYRGEKK
jgi:hypothetical protein